VNKPTNELLEIKINELQDALVQMTLKANKEKERAENLQGTLQKAKTHYKTKIQQAQQTINQLKEKEKTEEVEMAKTLKQIEDNFNIMKKRAIKAEKENKKLKDQLSSMMGQYDSQERIGIKEKANMAANLLEQTKKEAVESLFNLMKSAKNLGLIAEILTGIDRVFPTEKEDNNM